MSRITKDLRERMLKELVHHGYANAIKAADDAVKAVGDKVWEDIYADQISHMMALPSGFMRTDSSINVNWAGQRRHIRFSESKRVAEKHHSGCWSTVAKVYESHSGLMARYDNAQTALDDVTSKRDAAKRQAEATLNSVTTFKKLFEIWPDCRPLLEKFDEEKPTYAMTVPVAQLNAAFGLPVAEQGGV